MKQLEEFKKELTELINRHSLESHFNDTPDSILANVAIDAMHVFAQRSAQRDDYHEFRTADYSKRYEAIMKRINNQGKTSMQIDKKRGCYTQPSCKDCPFTDICPDVQKEPAKNFVVGGRVSAKDMEKALNPESDLMELIKTAFPGARIEVHRIDVSHDNTKIRRKRRGGQNG